MSTCTCCKFLLILGELWSYFVHFVSKYKNSWCAQIMGSFSSFFRTLLCSYHNILYSCGSQDLWSSWFNWYPLIACFNWYLLIAWLLVSLFVMSSWHINLVQSLGLNIVVFLQVFTVGHVYCIPLSCWEIHNLWRNTFYVGLLSFSPILAIDANGGEVPESFAEKVFRVLSLLWFCS